MFYVLFILNYIFLKKGNQINDIGKCLIVEALNENNNIQNIDFGCEFCLFFKIIELLISFLFFFKMKIKITNLNQMMNLF